MLQEMEVEAERAKTVSSVFHLHNESRDRELNVSLNGQRLTHGPHPVYRPIAITLDRLRMVTIKI